MFFNHWVLCLDVYRELMGLSGGIAGSTKAAGNHPLLKIKVNIKKILLDDKVLFYQLILSHRDPLSFRPYSQPFLGCWLITMTLSPLLKVSILGLTSVGRYATLALMVLSPAAPPVESSRRRETLPCGDGAGRKPTGEKFENLHDEAHQNLPATRNGF